MIPRKDVRFEDTWKNRRRRRFSVVAKRFYEPWTDPGQQNVTTLTSMPPLDCRPNAVSLETDSSYWNDGKTREHDVMGFLKRNEDVVFTKRWFVCTYESNVASKIWIRLNLRLYEEVCEINEIKSYTWGQFLELWRHHTFRILKLGTWNLIFMVIKFRLN